MDKLTDYKDASTYNNFYEFGTDKADPAKNAHSLKVAPWTVEIEGLVKKPGRYALEDLLKLSAQEERIYRMRCVEGRSMVIPWVGYSLSELIRRRLAADGEQENVVRPRFFARQPWPGSGPTDTAANHDSYLYGP